MRILGIPHPGRGSEGSSVTVLHSFLCAGKCLRLAFVAACDMLDLKRPLLARVNLQSL